MERTANLISMGNTPSDRRYFSGDKLFVRVVTPFCRSKVALSWQPASKNLAYPHGSAIN
jgi:hypothetical protein